MTAFYVNDKPYLAKNRVKDLTLIDLVECPLCKGILWSPIACQTCEKPYCSLCIQTWKPTASNSTQCVNKCPEYIERICPPSIVHILNTLQVTCRYEPNGCIQTLPYKNLEAHDNACGYQLMSCSGCDERIVKKDFQEHDNACSLVSLTCSECDSVYKRRDENEHTEIKCLRVQLHQIRAQMQQQEQEHNTKLSVLENQLRDLGDIVGALSV